MDRFVIVSSIFGAGLPVIRDTYHAENFPFGRAYVFAETRGAHRGEYTLADAMEVCDMLNRREATATS